jgi:hypothetical protein
MSLADWLLIWSIGTWLASLAFALSAVFVGKFEPDPFDCVLLGALWPLSIPAALFLLVRKFVSAVKNRLTKLL